MKLTKNLLLLFFFIFSFCMVITKTNAAVVIQNSDVRFKHGDAIEYSNSDVKDLGVVYPEFEVVVNNKKLKIDKDYTADVDNTGNTGKLIIRGIGEYTGTVEKPFRIDCENICTYTELFFVPSNYTLDYKSYSDGGFSIKSKFKLKKKPKILLVYPTNEDVAPYVLKEGQDYTIKYKSNGNKCSIKIKGINHYTGSIEIPYIANKTIYNETKLASKYNNEDKKIKKEMKKQKEKFFWKKPKFSKKPKYGYPIHLTKTTDLNIINSFLYLTDWKAEKYCEEFVYITKTKKVEWNYY